MNRFEQVKNVSRKERVAIANRHASIAQERREKLQKLAKEADWQIRQLTDKRLKHNRGG